jgi:cell cycle arrest protein BUB2
MKSLRDLELNAQEIIHHTMDLINRCPEDLYDVLARHPYDVTVYEDLFPNSTW